MLVRMGRAATELDVQTAQFEALPKNASNLCQIFKMQVEQSTFMKIAGKEIDWTFSDQEEVAIMDMRLGMEKNFLFGHKATITDPVKRTRHPHRRNMISDRKRILVHHHRTQHSSRNRNVPAGIHRQLREQPKDTPCRHRAGRETIQPRIHPHTIRRRDKDKMGTRILRDTLQLRIALSHP